MKKIFYSIAVLFFFISCGGKPENTEETVISKATIPTKSTSKSCLEDFIRQPCELLPQSMVEKYANGSEIEETGLANQKNLMMNECSYGWSGGRTQKIGNLELPVNDYIKLGMFEMVKAEDPIADFKRNYRTLSEAEKQKLQKDMDARLKQQLEDGKITQKQYEMSKGFSGIAGSGNYQAVENVGDIAVWNKPKVKTATPSGGSLIVQHANLRFEVGIDLGGEDDSKSKEVAIEIAKQILSKCE